MLPDPLPIGMNTTSGSIPTWPATTTVNFDRVGPGNFVSAYAPFSADQPARLIAKARPASGTESYGLLRMERDINVAAVNGVPQKDATAAAWIGYSANVQLFTKAQMFDLFLAAYAAMTNHYDRLVTGQT